MAMPVVLDDIMHVDELTVWRGAVALGPDDPGRPWDADEAQEVSPTIEDDAFVGWGATIVGPATIGRGAYVCAGAIVTRSVPDGMIVSGTNQVHSPHEWRGELGESEHFRRSGAADPSRLATVFA